MPCSMSRYSRLPQARRSRRHGIEELGSTLHVGAAVLHVGRVVVPEDMEPHHVVVVGVHGVGDAVQGPPGPIGQVQRVGHGGLVALLAGADLRSLPAAANHSRPGRPIASVPAAAPRPVRNKSRLVVLSLMMLSFLRWSFGSTLCVGTRLLGCSASCRATQSVAGTRSHAKHGNEGSPSVPPTLLQIEVEDVLAARSGFRRPTRRFRRSTSRG